jgi:uncharacterized protein YcnI
MLRSFVIAAAVCAFSTTSASAHVELETETAPVDSFYKAVLTVPHGCEGSATIRLRVQVPEGVISVKPMPKPGWQIEITKGKYAKSYEFYGSQLTEGVKELSWTGKLPDEYYDEFVFQAKLTDALKAGSMLYFPAVQECEKGVERWIEIPAEGTDPESYEHPAPRLELLPAK